MPGTDPGKITTALSTSWGGRRRTAAQSTSWGGRLSRSLAAAVAAAVAAVPVLVATPAGAATSAHVVVGTDAVAAVRSLGAGDVRTAGLPTAAVADLTPAQAQALRSHGLRVALDEPVVLTDDDDDDQPADRLVSATGRLSVRELVASDTRLTGSGVTVAVIDSGVEEVPALAGRVIQGADFTGTGLADGYGHGTFVAGLVAGDGTGTDGRRTGVVGVAPAARIVSVKVADDRGRSSVGELVLGLAWTLQNSERYGIDVVNLSVSAGRSTSFDASPVNALVEAAWFSGLTVIASAGNGGGAVDAAPGNDPWVLTVGSVYDRNTTSTGDDRRSPFSNAGTTPDGFAKPEVTSFGQHVQSVLPAGSALAGRQKALGLPAGYGQLSGTSMATGVASGLAALLEQARPSLSPDEVKSAFVSARRTRGQVTASRLLRARTGGRVNAGLRPSVALAAAYLTLVVGSTDPSTVDWDSVVWTEVTWTDVTWTNATWTNATWTNATWTNATWTSATWCDATWTQATWADSTWTDATWTQATWSS